MSDIKLYAILKKAKATHLLKPFLKKYKKKYVMAELEKDTFGVSKDVGATLEIADGLARALGKSMADRICGRLFWSHTTISYQMSVMTLTRDLQLPRSRAIEYIQTLGSEQKLFVHDKFILHRTVHEAMERIRTHLRERQSNPDIEHSLRGLLDSADVTDEQKGAVRMVCQNPVSIITGGPGTGKSHIVRLLSRAHLKTKVTAPTGRAARNAEGKTVHYFKTIQESGVQEFRDISLVIVDEASMVSARLLLDVFNMTGPDCHIVLVGDENQLPPIDTGDVLRDIIAWGGVAVTRLTHNHRSASSIQEISSSILQRVVPATWHADIAFVECQSLDDVLNVLPDVYTTHMIGADSIILTPRNKDRIAINRAMQIIHRVLDDPTETEVKVILKKDSAMSTGYAWLNGCSVHFSGVTNTCATMSAALDLVEPYVDMQEDTMGETRILPGDSVIVTKNTENACNGDIGRCIARQTISLEGARIEIPRVTDRDPGFQLAYAVTVHKSQGSEFDTVVVPITNTGSWSIPLLYTAITRAKKKIVFLGSQEDIASICNVRHITRPPFLLNILSRTV